jgi:leucyl-tRNA synthetase
MKRYNPKEIEPRWQQVWDDEQVYKADLQSDKPKYMAMSMFNYPSGAGIHIGHALNYTISDVMARCKRQQGFESYHPVGWDAFGLPAENYAIKAGVSPQQSMATIIPSYHKQYKAMGWSNDWSREIATCDPEYYRWTQWIFTQMYKHGLAYQDERMQWWCTKCQTVLSNEQVIDGKCWRHDAADDPEVQQKAVRQWFFRITDYADELLQATHDLDWSEVVKTAQVNWIGKSEGAEVDFALSDGTELNFVILHGFTGSNEKNFIPWLKHELEAKGYRVQAPQLPHTEAPTEAEQVAYVLENCQFDDHTVLIGHSLGGVVAMKVAEKLPHRIHSLVLVAPALPEAYRTEAYRQKCKPFLDTFDMTYDYDLIRQNASRRIVLSDTHEAELRKPYLLDLAKNLAADYEETAATERHFRGSQEPFILRHSVPRVSVFTTAHDTIFGATFMVLAPEHPLVTQYGPLAENAVDIEEYLAKVHRKSELERLADKTKSGVPIEGLYAINPLNGAKIPIWTADYVLMGYGTGAVMGVPGEDERDNEFAKKFGLPIVYTTEQQEFISYSEDIKPNRTKYKLAHSDEFDGMDFAAGRQAMLDALVAKDVGRAVTQYKIRDWSVSRQRYWGAPIPIVHCPTDGIVPVPEEQLPVVLPELADFRPSGDGRSALARATDWVHTTCPTCGGPAERETDTLDTYICSSWYQLRYLDPHNAQVAFDASIAAKWMPVDFYNGGDHATAHLIYVRFIAHFFHKLGLLADPEPFKKFLFNGKVTASDGTMFSKSKGNGVDPLEIIGQGYGADALRTYLMFAAPLELGTRWDPQGVPGAYRFLNRVWNLVQEYLESQGLKESRSQEGTSHARPPEPWRSEELQGTSVSVMPVRARIQTDKQSRSDTASSPTNYKLQTTNSQNLPVLRAIHAAIQKVTADLESQRYNTAIAAMMETTNTLYTLKAKQGFADTASWQFALESLVALVAPFAPHIADELWHDLGHTTSVQRDSWPVLDEQYLAAETITLAVQVNGKLRSTVEVPTNADEPTSVQTAKQDAKIAAYLAGKTLVKTIYVPKKLINFVVR